MCWHELQHFCCCFSVKQGVWITTFFHSLAMILILIESIHQPTYQDIKWVYEIIKILRFEPDKTHTIIITSLMGAGLFCNMLLMIGVKASNYLMMLPALAYQMLLVVITFLVSLRICFVMSEAQFFYSGLLPVVLAFILIYFWVVNFVYYRDLKLSTQKTLPNIVKSADEATASRTSGCLEPPSGTSMTYMDPSSTNLENPYMLNLSTSGEHLSSTFSSGNPPPTFRIEDCSSPVKKY